MYLYIYISVYIYIYSTWLGCSLFFLLMLCLFELSCAPPFPLSLTSLQIFRGWNYAITATLQQVAEFNLLQFSSCSLIVCQPYIAFRVQLPMRFQTGTLRHRFDIPFLISGLRRRVSGSLWDCIGILLRNCHVRVSVIKFHGIGLVECKGFMPPSQE